MKSTGTICTFSKSERFLESAEEKNDGEEVLGAFQQGEQDLRGPVVGFHGNCTDDCEGRVALRYVVGPGGLMWCYYRSVVGAP